MVRYPTTTRVLCCLIVCPVRYELTDERDFNIAKLRGEGKVDKAEFEKVSDPRLLFYQTHANYLTLCELQNTAIVRIEEIAPFPYDLVEKALNRYPNVHSETALWLRRFDCALAGRSVVGSRGADEYGCLVLHKPAPRDSRPHSQAPTGMHFLTENFPVMMCNLLNAQRYVGRMPAASPATGFMPVHKKQLRDILTDALYY